MAARKKKIVTDRSEVEISITLVPAYAIVFDHHDLQGQSAIGLSPAKAIASARALVADRFPPAKYDVTVSETNEAVFERAGIHFSEWIENL